MDSAGGGPRDWHVVQTMQISEWVCHALAPAKFLTGQCRRPPPRKGPATDQGAVADVSGSNGRMPFGAFRGVAHQSARAGGYGPGTGRQ